MGSAPADDASRRTPGRPATRVDADDRLPHHAHEVVCSRSSYVSLHGPGLRVSSGTTPTPPRHSSRGRDQRTVAQGDGSTSAKRTDGARSLSPVRPGWRPSSRQKIAAPIASRSPIRPVIPVPVDRSAGRRSRTSHPDHRRPHDQPSRRPTTHRGRHRSSGPFVAALAPCTLLVRRRSHLPRSRSPHLFEGSRFTWPRAKTTVRTTQRRAGRVRAAPRFQEPQPTGFQFGLNITRTSPQSPIRRRHAGNSPSSTTRRADRPSAAAA